jgi:ubiquinone/menaquinone biosynthesis C-methylase UbiE
MANLFICYRRGDSGDVAGRIYDRLLRTFGRSQVFRDVASVSDGALYADRILQALKNADVVLALMGPRWSTAESADKVVGRHKSKDWVRWELTKALKLDVPILPVTVGGARLPKLPAGLQKSIGRQAVQVGDDPDFHSDVDRLIATIQELVKTRRTTEKREPSLACPGPAGRIHGHPNKFCGAPVAPLSNVQKCNRCGTSWSMREGIPWLVSESDVREHDRRVVRAYGWIASLWDSSIGFLDVNRGKLVDDLRLRDLKWETGGRPACFLDVGVSTGTHLSIISKLLNPLAPASFWGVDLSEPMLRRCSKWVGKFAPHTMRVAGADAHRLPFLSKSFDRVISTGCDFADWRVVVSEMERVTRAGGIISIVTLRLASGASSLINCLTYRSHLWLVRERTPPNPVEFMSPDVTVLRDEQLNELFWMTTVRT